MLSLGANDVIIFGLGAISSLVVMLIGVSISRHVSRTRREITYITNIQLLARERESYPAGVRDAFEELGAFDYRRYIVAFLNTGTDALRESDINASDPISIRLENLEIDEARIKAQSSRGVGAEVEASGDRLLIHFDALERREGLSVVFFARGRTQPIVRGTLIAGALKKREKSFQVLQESMTVLLLMSFFVTLALVDFSDLIQRVLGVESVHEIALLMAIAAVGAITIPWLQFQLRSTSKAFGEITVGEGDYYPSSVRFADIAGR
ncbi:MAG: hypothetical protein MI723_09835, partial [Caulobacterales bacterium]|nr:hypothetical protein [Caulobacterales bacterium]